MTTIPTIPDKLVVEWAKTTFNNESFKDAKVWSTKLGEGAVAWKWLDDGTRHASGITIDAVQLLLRFAPDTVILTQGFDGRLNVPQEIIDELVGKGIKVISTTTKSAVETFNYLVSQKENVAGLFHSTC